MDGLERRLSRSLQLRLSLAISMAILLVASLTGAFSYVSAFDEALELQDNSLRQVAALFARQRMTLEYPQDAAALANDDEETRIVVQYLADGASARHTDDSRLPLPIPATVAEGLSTVDVGGEPFRIVVDTAADGRRFVVAQEIDSRNRDARASAWRALLPFAILFPVLLLVVADLIRKLFRPVAGLAAMLDRRTDHDLRPVDDQALATEIRPFVHAINRLLERVARTLDAQKRFVADAAHELRTPMTALSLQAEALEAEPMSAQAQARLAVLRRGIRRNRKLVEQLLQLASAQMATQASANVSIHAACRQVLEDLMPLAEQKQLDLAVDGDDACVDIREVELRAVIRNLLENAIRHAPICGQVELRVTQDASFVELCVRDNGPGIAPEAWQRVFDPFYRAPGNLEEGSGLGLSIVRTIVLRTGGSLDVGYADGTHRRGWQVCVRWPAA